MYPFCNLYWGGYTIGNAGKVYSAGLVYSFALLGFSLKEVLVALFIAPKMDRFRDCHSIGDIVEKSYGQSAKVFTGVLSLIVCGGILGAQVGAISSIISATLPINPTLGAVIALGILLAYASLGGMRAVVFTDALQFSILLIGIPLTFFVGLKAVGGWHVVRDTVPHDYLYFLSGKESWIFFVLLFITFIFGETLVPPYVQRLFMARSSTHTVKGTLASGLVSIPLFLICGGVGLVAYTYNQNLPSNEAFTTVVSALLPVGIKGFVIAALLSIILSSAAGFLNAASIAFVNDIVKPFKKSSDKINFLALARISTLLVGLISIVFALTVTSVLDILLVAYNFWSPIILVPLVAAIFGFRCRPVDFYTGAMFGILGSLLWHYGFQDYLGISPILLGIVFNLMAFLMSRMLMPRAIVNLNSEG